LPPPARLPGEQVRRNDGAPCAGAKGRMKTMEAEAVAEQIEISATKVRSYLAADTTAKQATAALYSLRKNRQTNPEGEFDSAKRWYPSAREDADGDGSRTRSPSRAWPYSYMLRCRTRQHCAVLVARALAGHDVPADVRKVVGRLPAKCPCSVFADRCAEVGISSDCGDLVKSSCPIHGGA
jgi:hypothetical protein